VKDFTTEADARIIVDGLLRQAGWDPADKSQVLTEVPFRDSGWKVAEPVPAYGHRSTVCSPDDDSLQSGKIDYVLLSRDGRHLAVVEAKRAAIDPYCAKQQALAYAHKTLTPFIFLTNGEVVYFWDHQKGDARPVNSFFSRYDLERIVELRHDRKNLADVEIPAHYVGNSEMRTVRNYQIDAMRTLDGLLERGNRRFLIQLPTGTGKTDLVCLYLKRLLIAGWAGRILFLVDREQLAKQAHDAITELLSDYPSYWLKAGMRRQEQQITVCLLQTMIGQYTDFSSGYFDVVVADECHRSIYGQWQNALTHFDAIHIGLTATPSPFIERDTFEFYQCEGDKPHFSLDIRTAIAEGHLTPYSFATRITKLLAEGIENDPAEFERKWTNEATNRLMMKEFDSLAHQNFKELAPNQKTPPGKTIVFAITKHHAAALTRYLNELHPECRGRYAEVITSDVMDATSLIRKFKGEEYPQVAVSVGMLDTGFNCREVLHLVMCRRVRSPILYQQMRGRALRTAPHIGKCKAMIYDFFRNHEYFNDSDTDPFSEYGGHGSAQKDKKVYRPSGDLIELGLQDEWLSGVNYVEVGPEGERIDRSEYIASWRTTIERLADDEGVAKIKRGEALTPEEEQSLTALLNSPKNFFNEDNLRRAYQQPGSSIVDFIRAALGCLKIKTREEIVNERFQAWIAAERFTPDQAKYLAVLKNRGIAVGTVAMADLFEPPLSRFGASDIGVRLFGADKLKSVVAEMNNRLFPKSTG